MMTLFYNDIKWDEYKGYPRASHYKYLGIIIDNYMNPYKYVKETTKRIDIYVRRNYWLIKKYFSIRSLIQINEYFQQSRLLYGVNVFLPLIKITKKVEA